jgi:hypothetical protein
VAGLPELAFNNRAVIDCALTRLRHSWSTPTPLQPAARELHPSELSTCESISATPGQAELPKWILARDIVRHTGGSRSEGAHRPARLYAFTSREPVVF